jgi:hypothetical protein
MSILSVQETREILKQGADILAPALVPHGFVFNITSSGNSSGGAFSRGDFVREDRCLELHFRYSLGLVKYYVGALSLGHEDYMRALNGQAGVSHYPGFSQEALAAFEALRQDLIERCSDFVSGTGEQFRQCVDQHRHYESLPPLQKAEYRTA